MKKLYLYGIITLILILCISCSKTSNTEDSKYLRCNATSDGMMAETESGFYYVFDSILYYADKDNMNFWIPVCNQPNCNHSELECNAYLSYTSGLAQKNGKLYGINIDYTNGPYVYEVSVDGSGLKFVYDIPFEKDIFISKFRSMLSQNQLVMYYGYMEENGMFHENIGRLENNVINVLYTESSENAIAGLNLPASSLGVRGDEAMMSSLLTGVDKNYLNILWRTDREILEKVNLPEDVSIEGGYLSEKTFTYFKQKEGFYEVDLETGEKTLIEKNNLEDSVGFVLTEDYMIEWNRYRGYTPDEASLKFYNGKRWLDVLLPKEVEESNDTFVVVSVASDRIFMAQMIEEVGNTRSNLYYFMLEDENPELIHCSEITRYDSQEETETSEGVLNSVESSAPEKDIGEIIIFDEDEYTLKITGINMNGPYGYTINTYVENKSSDKEYIISVGDASINGLQCSPHWGLMVSPGEKCSDEIRFNFDYELALYRIEDIYSVSEYTDIELTGRVYNIEDKFEVEKSIHIYPYGEENAIKFVREPQSTDTIVVDNEYATIIILGYEEGMFENSEINVFFVNKTDERVSFRVEEIAVNGKNLEIMAKPFYSIIVNGGCSAYHTIYFEEAASYIKDFVEENQITKAEEIEMIFRIFTSDSSGRPIGEDLVNETVTLYPEKE